MPPRDRASPLAPRAASLDAVAVFVEVVRARSFTGAARALGLPKSTVSVRVTELEAQLGVTLLLRTTRRVEPTTAGEAYFAAAARSLADLQAAGLEASQAQTEPSGLLRVTCTGVGSGYVGDHIAEYLALYPRVSVDLRVTEQLIDLLSEGIDVAFRIGPLGDETALTAHRIDSTELALYASPAYLRRHGTPAHPRDLERHALLLISKHPRLRLQRPADRERHEVQAPPRFVANHVAALRHQALRDVGVAVLPSSLAEDDRRAGALVRLLDGWIVAHVPVHLVYARQRHLPQRVRLFVELVLQRMSRAAPRRAPR